MKNLIKKYRAEKQWRKTAAGLLAALFAAQLLACSSQPTVVRDETDAEIKTETESEAETVTETETETETVTETETETETEAETETETEPETEETANENAMEKDFEEFKQSVEELQRWFAVLQEDNQQADAYLKDEDKVRAEFVLGSDFSETKEKLLSLFSAGQTLEINVTQMMNSNSASKELSEIEALIAGIVSQHESYQQCFDEIESLKERMQEMSGVVTLDDFAAMSGWRRERFMARYGDPDEEDSGVIKFEGVTFEGHEGHLRVFFDENMQMNCISWTSYTSSQELHQELLQYIRSNGTEGNTLYPKEGQIEEGTYVNGVEVFAGYEDSESGQYTYVFAFYPNR